MMSRNSLIRLTFLTAIFTSAAEAAAGDKLIELIPDDAVGVFYIDRPQHALPPKLVKPLFEAMTDDKALAEKWVEAIRKVHGSTMVVLLMPPQGKDDPDVMVAMELPELQTPFDELLEKVFLPLAEEEAKSEEDQRLRVEKGKTGNRILAPDGKPLFAYATKDKLAMGSTRGQDVLRWVGGQWPGRKWADQPGVRRMIARLPRETNLRGYFNPAPLLKQAGKPAPNSLEELALKVFAPEDVQAVAMDLSWSREAVTVKITAALADECHGLVKGLARPTSTAKIMGAFPEDFVAVGRVGWHSASDVVDGAYAVADTFDPNISAEYREELAEFKKETGVDWDTGILGNLVGEAAFGVRVDFTKKNPIGVCTAFPLADEAKFREQFDKLVEHFDLQFRDDDKSGVLVRKIKMSSDPASEKPEYSGDLPPSAPCLAIDHGLLLVGSDTEIVADVARQAAGGKPPRPANPNLKKCYEVLGDPNHLAVMVDIAQIRKNVPFAPLAAGPELGPLIMDGFAGLSLTVKEHLATADLVWSLRSAGGAPREPTTSSPATPGAEQALLTLTKALGASLGEARRQARQVVSMSNMRGVGMALHQFAGEHKGAFPESLEALLKAMPDAASLKSLTSPYNGKGPKSLEDVRHKSYLVYRPGLMTSSPPQEVLMAERDVHDGGACFLFVDGHVEFIPDPKASELLAKIEAGEAEIRP
jgi:prepilin-type processing-associated H-X9-DG protein